MNVAKFLLLPFLIALLGCQKNRVQFKHSLICYQVTEKAVHDPFHEDQVMYDADIRSQWKCSGVIADINSEQRAYLSKVLYHNNAICLKRLPFGGPVKLLVVLDPDEQPILAFLKYREENSYRVFRDIVYEGGVYEINSSFDKGGAFVKDQDISKLFFD